MILAEKVFRTLPSLRVNFGNFREIFSEVKSPKSSEQFRQLKFAHDFKTFQFDFIIRIKGK